MQLIAESNLTVPCCYIATTTPTCRDVLVFWKSRSIDGAGRFCVVNEADVRRMNFLQKLKQSDNVIMNQLYKMCGKNRLCELTNKYCCSNKMVHLGFKDVVFKHVFSD